MLSVLHLAVPQDEAAAVHTRLRELLSALSGRPGWRGGRVVRSLDDPGNWLLLTEWSAVGDYRRAMGSTAAKLALGPLTPVLLPDGGAFEELPEGSVPTGAAAGEPASNQPGASGR